MNKEKAAVTKKKFCLPEKRGMASIKAERKKEEGEGARDGRIKY